MVYSSDGGDNGSMRIGNADEGTGWMKEETKNFVNKFFHGRSGNMAAALMADDDLTKEDIKELRDFFNSRF